MEISPGDCALGVGPVGGVVVETSRDVSVLDIIHVIPIVVGTSLGDCVLDAGSVEGVVLGISLVDSLIDVWTVL